jgi:hypothetical protein
MYSAVNSTLVTLIPKHSAAKTIKEYRPISCCTTIFKVISKILTKRSFAAYTGMRAFEKQDHH